MLIIINMGCNAYHLLQFEDTNPRMIHRWFIDNRSSMNHPFWSDKVCLRILMKIEFRNGDGKKTLSTIRN